MRHTAISIVLASVVVLVSAYLPQGPDYSKYDQQKLQQRYDLIQALVQPRPSYNYRPKIGAAYAKKAYLPTSYGNPQYYNNRAPVAATTKAYAPAQSSGYRGGYNNAVAVKPAQYGYQGYNGIRFGGGQVHPIFNNALLYKNDKVNLGPYDSTAPIFIGGSPKTTPNAAFSRSGFNYQPQVDAYGNRPAPAVAYPYFG